MLKQVRFSTTDSDYTSLREIHAVITFYDPGAVSQTIVADYEMSIELGY
jgi:hypothetical protein